MTSASRSPLTRVLTLLGLVAAEPKLGGILLLDLEPALLPLLGDLLADRMAAMAPEQSAPDVVMLGSWATAEDLWLRTGLMSDGFGIVRGALVEDAANAPPVILIPDLGHAGLVVTQAAVTLLDSDAASVEMFGHSLHWWPRARWLAAASRAEVSRLSPHLLDRFAARVDAAGLPDCLRTLKEQAAEPTDDLALLQAVMPSVPAADRRESLPFLTSEATRLVVSLMPTNPSRRRDLVLARTARGLAVAAGDPSVLSDHVLAAADLLGVSLADETASNGNSADSPESAVPSHVSPELLAPSEPPIAQSGQAADGPPALMVVTSAGPPVPLESITVNPDSADRSPYPEDDPQVLPPFGSLRRARRPFSGTRSLYGHPIGLRQARDLRDLAVVPSTIEAIKFRSVRSRKDVVIAGRLIVNPSDLRQYLRRPESGAGLVLVLDHSCRSGWDWSPALAPYLRWSYQENSALSVIEFGHRDTADELIAEHYRAFSLQDPRVLGSLNRSAGVASPLAHALDLAVHELRRMLRHARTSVDEAVLVVITDGRGNVPLDASLRGRMPGSVSRQGIDDALRAAAAVRAIARVRTVVIAPETDLYPELTIELAVAAGGKLISVPAQPASADAHR